MARVAFIGLGTMGAAMAGHLHAKGHEVIAFDVADAALDHARQLGLTVSDSAADAAAEAEVVVTMLPASRDVVSVYRTQVFFSASAGALLLDCSTIDIETARMMAAEAADRGFSMLDAPVLGGIAAAQAGTLTFMVGGDAEAFMRAKEVFLAMGDNVIHAGASGAGQIAKMCNNLIVASTMVATAESMGLAQKLGMDPKKFYEIAANSSGQSWSLTSRCPFPGVGPESPADWGYEKGYAASLMLKDLKLALSAALQTDASVPMGSLSKSLYQALVNGGAGQKDFSAIVGLLQGKLPEAS